MKIIKKHIKLALCTKLVLILGSWLLILTKANAQTGATLPFTAYEAENAATNAQVLAYSTTYRTLASEASGRRAVQLNTTSDYVEFTLTEAANAFVLRFCIPDLGASNVNLGFSINNNAQSDIVLTSKYAWVYGDYPYNDNSSSGNGHRFYDEKIVKLSQTYPAGTKFKFIKNANCNASYYVIDLLETEIAPAANTQPANSISLTSYGATPNDGNSDNTAFQNALNAAISQNKILWIPEGDFTLTGNSQISINAAVTIQGAGMWYTSLSGDGVRFNVKASNVTFKDFMVHGAATYRIDDGGQTAIESDFYTNISNLTIQNLWVEHTKCAFWLHQCNNAQIKNNRVRTTFADGIHLRKGCKNAVIEHNHVRNTGDDGIAQWSADIANENNIVRYNTVELPSLANGIAVYGGANIEVSNNIVKDIVRNGAGINMGTDHNPISCNGYFKILNNTLTRCGSSSDIHTPEIGAIWLCVINGIGASISIENNTITNATFHGILVQGNANVSNILVKKNNISGVVNCVHIGTECNGSMTLQCNTFANYASIIYNAASGFSTNTNDVDCGSVDPPPTDDYTYVLRFKAPTSWTACYAYVYTNGATLSGTGEWSNQQALSQNTDGFYTYTLVRTTELTGQVYVIFNNKADKGQDIDIVAYNNTCWESGNISGYDNYQNAIYTTTQVDCSASQNQGQGTKNKEQRLVIYPNPVSTELFVESRVKNQESRFEIYDISGKLQLVTTLSQPYHNLVTTINVADLTAGIYFLKIGDKIAKFVKK